MTGRALNVQGTRYGSWLVVARDHNYRGSDTRWVCRCDCGTQKSVNIQPLRNGTSTSCGCQRGKLIKRHHQIGDVRRHDMPEYRTWSGIKTRCFNIKDPKYPLYGGRGVVMCPEWQASFERFLADVGTRPSEHHTLDRRDPNGNYEPSNCRWATIKEQNRNKRTTRFIIYNGERRKVAEVAEEIGQSINTVWRNHQQLETT